MTDEAKRMARELRAIECIDCLYEKIGSCKRVSCERIVNTLGYKAASLIERQAAELDGKQGKINRLTAELAQVKRERHDYMRKCLFGY